MSFAVLKTVKFTTREEPFRIGDQITYKDFCKELPESHKRERIIAQLKSMRRIVDIPDREIKGKTSKLINSFEGKPKLKVTKKLKQGWYLLSDGSKVHGQKALEKALK